MDQRGHPNRRDLARGAGPAAPTELLAYARTPAALRPGNRITALVAGGEIFPAMLEAIRSAREYVHLETYILRADRVGWRFAEALADRARAGVTVRLLFDSIGSFALDPRYVTELRRSGAEVEEFHPVEPWRKRFGLSWITRRDHRKILVVDGRVAFTGGVNIGEEYEAAENGGGGWHDVHARVEGPIVADLDRLFRKSWIYAGGRPYPPPPEKPLEGPPPGDALAMVVDNKIIRHRLGIRRAYLHAIGQARRTIRIMNAYFLPDRGIRAALRRAVARGVSVQVLVPGRSDIPAVSWATRHLYARFLKDGIRIFEWPEKMMHAKTAVIDGVWSTIGSYNLDSRSLLYNLEVMLAILDPRFGAEMDAQFEKDAARCVEIELSSWRRRPWWHRPIEWFFFQLRRWL